MSGLPMLGTSEIGSFRCPQQWWWKYRMGLEPKYQSSHALWFGIGVHIALAKWYRKGQARGEHPAYTFEKWAGDEIHLIKNSEYVSWDEDEPRYLDLTDMGIAMLDEYVKYWGRDPQWHVIGTETPFQVTVIDRGKPIATFASIWDLVYRDLADGKIYLGEHKTAKQIALAYLELDVQAGMYAATAEAMLRAKGLLKDKERIAGIQYNFLRKAFPDDRPKDDGGAALNKDGKVSKRQQAPLFVRPDPIERSQREMAAQLTRFSNTVTVMNAVRDGIIPVTKVSGKDCPFCPYFDMCKLHERGSRSYQSVMKSMYDQRDPYRDKRKSAGG